MSLKSASSDILLQLADVIGQLTDANYACSLDVLSGNTIGKHVRHILEFYELLVNSAETGQLNYDRRQRDLRLEVATDEALRRIGILDRAIHRLDLNQLLWLDADWPASGLTVVGPGALQIPSSFARELLYNIEHAIHHMVMIQIAVRSNFPNVTLPPHFGVAYSTIQHQAQNPITL